jgi:hypothetical protein
MKPVRVRKSLHKLSAKQTLQREAFIKACQHPAVRAKWQHGRWAKPYASPPTVRPRSDDPEEFSNYDLQIFGWLSKLLLHDGGCSAEIVGKLPASLQSIIANVQAVQQKYRPRTLIEKLQDLGEGQRDLLGRSVFMAGDSERPPKSSTSLEDVAAKIQGVRWLWNGWIPYGMVTLLFAEPGVGKSAFVLGSIVTAIVNRRPFLDNQGGFRDPQSVIWCDTEAAHAMTVERAMQWGTPMGRLLLNGDDPFKSFSLDSAKDLSELRDQIRRERVPLVVIDALRSAHSGEENSSQKVGEVMQKLAHMAQETGVAIVVVHHSRKIGEGQNVDHNSARGSNAVIALARSVIALSKPDRENDAIRVEVVKSNVASHPPPLGFRISETGIVRCSAPYAKKREKPPSQLEIAQLFLREQLANGAMKVTEVTEAADAGSIAAKTLRRAKELLGIRSGKRGNEWWWELPSQQPAQKKVREK